MGFGAEAWRRLFPGRGKPRELETFQAIKGAKYTAVTGMLFFIPSEDLLEELVGD